jgi:RNA polymerase-binding transcription factor DksA
MLSQEQINHLERRLLEERSRTVEVLRGLNADLQNNASSDGDLSKMPTHLADQGTDVQEEETDIEVAEMHTARLQAIDEALVRLRETPGEFDVSEVSGEPISFERLDMVPWTRVRADEKGDERAASAAGRSDRPAALPRRNE